MSARVDGHRSFWMGAALGTWVFLALLAILLFSGDLSSSSFLYAVF